MGVLHGILDPHFADWPHLYFYLSAAWLAPFHWLGLVSDQASGYLGVRILDAIIGSLTVLLAFEFARRAYGTTAGFLSGAAIAVAFLHVRDSHFATVDVPLTFACLGALYVAYRTIGLRGARPLLLNGVLLGIAASLKYNGALVASGISAAQVLRARTQETPPRFVLGRLILIAVVGLATLIVTSPFLVLDPPATAHGIPYIFQHLATATTPAPGWVQLFKALWYGLDPALLGVAAVGIIYATLKRQPADWILLAFIAVYVVLVGAGGSVFFRYADPLIPPLLLLGGRALAQVVQGAASGSRYALALGAALVIVLAPSLAHDVSYDTLVQQTDTRTLAYSWLNVHVPADSRVAVAYYSGAAHDQAMVDSGEHSHGATDPYVKSFLYNRLETAYSIFELTGPLQASRYEPLKAQGVRYVVFTEDTPGGGCRIDTALERLLAQQGARLASFSPTVGCPDSAFDPIDSYYVPFSGYGGWVRPGPWIRIYRLRG
jgi:hypothetical protein